MPLTKGQIAVSRRERHLGTMIGRALSLALNAATNADLADQRELKAHWITQWNSPKFWHG
jgi:hypothetical protein